MRKIISKIFFVINNIRLNLNFKKKIKVALTSRIKQKTILEGFNKVGKDTYISGYVDKYTYIGERCILSAEIGKFCSIANNVKIISGTHPLHYLSTSPVFFSKAGQCGMVLVEESKVEEIIYADREKKISCKIGNDVWIGEDALIRGGVVIGNGAVIAMGAVVVNDVEPYSIVGGVPARVIRYRFDKEVRMKLDKSKWWDIPIEDLKNQQHNFSDVEAFINEMEK